MKKFLSSVIMVVVALLITIIPAMAQGVNALTADESVNTFAALETAINNASSNVPYAIEITSDISFPNALVIPAGKDITIFSTSNTPGNLTVATDSRHFSILGSLTLQDIVLTGNIIENTTADNTQLGGGVSVENGGDLIMNSGTIITNCYNSSGGGVLIGEHASFVMNDGEISHNKTMIGSYNGGGVSLKGEGSDFTMNDGSINDNSSIWGSGVGMGMASTFTMEGGTISKNKSLDTSRQGGGGGVHVYVMSTFTMNDGVISDNSDWYGGGVLVGQSSHVNEPSDWCMFIFNDGEISGNTSTFGGGIHAQWNGIIEMNGGTISDNLAYAGGGVMLSTANNDNHVSFTMTGGKIINNNVNGAQYGGGGLAVLGDRSSIAAVIDGSNATTPPLIQGNTAGNIGGGIYLHSNSLTVSGAEILDNVATKDGGGIYVNDDAKAVLTVGETEISGNTSNANGGGIYVSKGGTATINSDVKIANNAAIVEGGGIYSAKYTSYLNTMDAATDYSNITTAADTIFSGNSANGLHNPPDNASAFTNLGFTDVSSNLVGHVLNNYDINFALPPVISYDTVIYHANDGTAAPTSVPYSILSGDDHTVLDVTDQSIGFTRSGYTFAGWNELPNGSGKSYLVGSTISNITSTVDLYAQWQSNSTGGGGGGTSYTVRYDANGGKGSASDSGLSSGTTYTVKSDKATDITNDNYIFKGWNTHADGNGTAYSANDTFRITSDVTLFAQWDSPKPGLNADDHMAYIVGYPDATVRPESNLTRAEAVTIFFRLLTPESRNEYWATTNQYSDVASTNWFNNAVSTMSKAGIVTGFSDGSFGGDRNITRAEFAAIAARFDSGVYTGENLFTDISGHWAAEDINRAAEKGWINGYPDGTFKPEQSITRSEAATLINQVLKRDKITAMHDDMIVWPDNPAGAWYYEAIEEATNSHDYSRSTNGYETWTKILPLPDWAALEKSWSGSNIVK